MHPGPSAGGAVGSSGSLWPGSARPDVRPGDATLSGGSHGEAQLGAPMRAEESGGGADQRNPREDPAHDSVVAVQPVCRERPTQPPGQVQASDER